MFWWGLICGLFVGSWIGLFLAAMCVVADDKKYAHPDVDEAEVVKQERPI